MSDFDRNLAARGSFGADRAVAIDAGLRASSGTEPAEDPTAAMIRIATARRLPC